MNKEILNELTFGFEIEGMFKEGINKFVPGIFVSDGSVRSLVPTFEAQLIPRSYPCVDCIRNEDQTIHTYCSIHHAVYRREGGISTEYNSPIFADFKKLLEVLKKFDNKNHIWNRTCGLHLHVGIKSGNCTKLYNSMSNMNLLDKIEKEAITWCPCQEGRLVERTAYYDKYPNSNDLISCTKGNYDRKYRLMRFHREHHTLEFRFLCPCEHKVQNVIKLMNIITGYLGSNEKVNRKVIAEASLDSRPSYNINGQFSNHAPIIINKKLHPGKEVVFSDGTSYFDRTLGGYF